MSFFLFCLCRWEKSALSWSLSTFSNNRRRKFHFRHWTGSKFPNIAYCKLKLLSKWVSDVARFLVYNVDWVDWAIGVHIGEILQIVLVHVQKYEAENRGKKNIGDGPKWSVRHNSRQHSLWHIWFFHHYLKIETMRKSLEPKSILINLRLSAMPNQHGKSISLGQPLQHQQIATHVFHSMGWPHLYS